jgi:hypothetical protein
MRSFILIFTCFLALSSVAQASDLCDETRLVIQPGDILFLGIKTDPLGVYARIAKANNTWVNHVGIAFFDDDGEWRVNESTVPRAKATKLCTFIKRAKPGKFAVKRLRMALHTRDIELLQQAAKARLGRYYDLGFDFDHPKKQYCSKFVYEVYQEAMRVEIGKIQTIREVFEASPDREDQIGFWKRWYFGKIPWDRRIVTPYSQYTDSELETVLDKSI